MLKKKYKRSSIVLVSLLLLLYVISTLSILTNTKFINSESNNIKTIPFSIKTSSNNPPNQEYFKYYKIITINHEMLVSGTYRNFPVLISILDSDLHDHVNQSNGNDIAFANDTDWLDHEIELFNKSYDDTYAQLIAWVRIPSLSKSDNTTLNIYMYYGNATMSSRQNPTGVWDSSYKGVWHLSELSGSAIDSTSYGSSGGVSPGGVSRGATGQIDGAYDFGNNGQVNFYDPSDEHLDFGTGSFTISFWMNIDASTANYQIPLHKGATTEFENGYDFETDPTADYLTFRICEGSNLVNSPVLYFDFDSWIYVTGVVDRISSRIRIFKNGLQVGSGNSLGSVGNIDSDHDLVASYGSANMEIDGLLDEIRICSVQRSAGWIANEYSNQNDPQSFLIVGPEELLDNTPPTYSNLIESANPLELGATEVITVNISDPSGINQVMIEYEGSNNLTMTNIGGDTWQNNTWTPNTVGNYTYTIYMKDNFNNWNSTIGSIEVIDTTPPTYSNLLESADPLQVGQNETISIKVYDSPGSGVNQVLLEYDSSNHTMDFIGGNTWIWSKWKPNYGPPHPYKVYMQDNEDNWNMTSGTITVVDTTAPVIENLNESDNILELGNINTISVDVFDTENNVSTVLIEFDDVNNTMTHIGGNTYQYNCTKSVVGIVYYKIYANDSDNNWNSLSSSFDIIDTTPPDLSGIQKGVDPLELGSTMIISVNSTDLSDIKQVKVEFEGFNYTMSNAGANLWESDPLISSTVGNCLFTVWAEDNNNNWGFISDSVFVQDTTAPTYSSLNESANPVELGTFFTITINATDLANIKEVMIEYDSNNHTMDPIDDDIWECSSWMPDSTGNFTYKIYITDNNDNLNFINSWILVIDTIIPNLFTLFEDADPLELGDNQIIRINANDLAGINQCLIEYEGTNHSMINIYGDIWQFDSWNPNNWTIYQYRIWAEDKSGNWNFVSDDITVQDTTPPSSPILTNSPSGDVNGNLVFDWLDGSDPSGISYYILIIDNESNPEITPGYVYKVNTTNSGPGSSYFQLPETLPVGQYYYFLAQIDGVGQQSSYTMGTFRVISIENGTPGEYNLIIILIIVASIIGSSTAIIIVRKKLKKDITPPRKKMPFKIISSHIDKLSILTLPKQEEIVFSSTELPEEEELVLRINELKYLGEELFAEGAYLEAQTQFKLAKELLLNLGREEEANLLTELISEINLLFEAREKRIELLEKLKLEGNSSRIFELYHDIINISEKLRDTDALSMFKSELINYFQLNKSNLADLEQYRFELNQKAELLVNNNNFEMAAQFYEKCENISQLLIQLEREEETASIEEFRNKKTECLKKIA